MKLPLRMLQWLTYLPLHLLVTIARYPLAPIAVVFFTTNDKRQLLFPFIWLETIDNDLSGDDGWRNEHIKPGSDPLSTWNRIKWLWRNGGNRFNYMVLGCRDDLEFRRERANVNKQRDFWQRPDGYWLWRSYHPVFGRYLELFLGWSLYGPKVSDNKIRCKFVATIRIKASAG